MYNNNITLPNITVYNFVMADKELIVILGDITFLDNVIQHASKNKIYVMAWREWEHKVRH